ncbi:MAG: hypothetical protein KJ070_01065 [Verrucomicrobia bacterium]|nr:hypothetical protein [Verrucomicrobiota bacterium]
MIAIRPGRNLEWTIAAAVERWLGEFAIETGLTDRAPDYQAARQAG